MFTRLRPVLFIPCAAVLPVMGAGTSTEAAFGIQAHLASPLGKFADAGHLDRRPGFGLGFNVPFHFGNGHVLRPKLDYLTFTRDRDGLRYKADTLALLLDYTCFLNQDRDGAYVIAGLGAHSTRRDVEGSLDGLKVKADGSATGFAYDVGIGYAFTSNMALELKYLGAHFRDLETRDKSAFRTFDPAFMANSLVMSVSFTF